MKTILIIASLLVSGYFVTSNFQEKPKGIEVIDAPTFYEKTKEENVVVLDVRTLPEFNSGHLKGAVHNDINQSAFKEKLQELDKSKTYLVYCHSGVRSAKASRIMASEGFEVIYDLQGGITAWKKQNLPLEQR